jgi:hypothetical protein
MPSLMNNKEIRNDKLKPNPKILVIPIKYRLAVNPYIKKPADLVNHQIL